jgi:uncharacterized protein
MLPLTLLVALSALTPPSPTHWVNDPEGVLAPATRDSLDAQLATYERASGHQVVVWVASSTNGEPIEQFAERAFAAWKVGRAGLDDGVVLFVFTKDRTVRLEVGYGLEGVLPDAVCARIIRDQLAPKLAAGELGPALVAGVDAITHTVGIGAVVLALLVLFILRPGLMLQLLSFALIFRRGGGGGSGGFGGRGGRSGGGGASGGF